MLLDRSQPANVLTNLRAFANYVAATKRDGRPGLTLIVVAMKDLEVTLDMRAARAELCQRLSHKARELESRVFNLNNRLVALVPQQDRRGLMQSIYDVRMLVTRTIGPRASELGLNPADLTHVLHTGRDATELRRLSREAVLSSEQLVGRVGPPGDFGAEHVTAIAERAKAAGAVAFMREFARSQAIARVRPGESPKTVGWEVFVSISHLRSQLLDHVSFDPDPELFHALTRIFDRMMMGALAETRLVEGHLSINLNVETLISEEFEDFARFMARQDETELWVELKLDDVLTHLEAFRKAEQFLRRFRVFTMLDQVPPERVPEVRDADFVMDGYKFVHDPKDPFFETSGTAIYELSSRHPVVVTRVEQPEAIEAAQTLGVRHFQGWHIDDVLSSGEVAFSF